MFFRMLFRIACLGAQIVLGLIFLNSASASVASTSARPPPKAVSPAKTADAPIDVRLERRKVVISAGKETLQAAETAKPGDVLEDAATYLNKSPQAIFIPVATLPVPLNTELILASVKPSSAFASTDGTNFYAIPLTVKVKQTNGVELEQAIALSEYRFLRWYPGELAAKQSVVFSARFKVSDGAETTIVKR